MKRTKHTMDNGKMEKNMAKASTLMPTKMCTQAGGHLERKMEKALMFMLRQISE